MRFPPIAIVGQSCTLPGANSPEALWGNVLSGRSSLSAAPEGRWGVERSRVLVPYGRPSLDATWSDVGGYISDFYFDASGFSVPADELHALDPLFQLTLHGVRSALVSAGLEGVRERTGLIMGNLSFPSAAMARFAQSVWLDSSTRPHPKNRFNSGLPALLTARALGLQGGAFALDAACASSLYAIKLACDRLHDGTADVMVAGAVNQTDDLFLHLGFSALSALSKTGQSRPFHRDADGLVPAEGAAFVVLQRLPDALASGCPILGVIRGVGLSNDGRGRGFLAPSEEGQVRALKLAYAEAGLTPADIGLIECHATGTPVGDATELKSTASVFAGCSSVPIGSLKSNLGHLITVAGVAGLLKVLAALKHEVKPPTLHADSPTAVLKETPFRLLREAEPWAGPRRAAVSAFGFGGNNAHLLVESVGEATSRQHWFVPAPIPAVEVAIVGVGARVGTGRHADDFKRELFGGRGDNSKREHVEVALEGLRFPPSDLQQTLAQQTLILEAGREAVAGLSLPRERTSVLVGMGCDAEAARFGARWRWPQQAERDEVSPPLLAAGVVGAMPNIPANRLNSQLDVAGPSFTVSAEEASGLAALERAARALKAGEIDAALVGAVDLSHEPAHQAALSALGQQTNASDAAVMLVLKRLPDAQRDGDPIFAVLGPSTLANALQLSDSSGSWTAPLGKAHAAHGLVQVAAGALALRHAARPQPGRDVTPWLGPTALDITVEVMEGPPQTVQLRGVEAAPWCATAPPRFHQYCGANRAAVLDALKQGLEGSESAGPSRLVLVASSQDELKLRSDAARRWLESGGHPPEGVAYRDAPLKGELAFVFPGAAAAYAGMGRELSLAFPKHVQSLMQRCPELSSATDWLYGTGNGTPQHPLEQLWGSSYLCQLHAELSQQVLGLKPQAAIGYSSGETNALFATGVWTDLGAMMQASRQGPLFTRELVGDVEAPRRAWRKLGLPGTAWASYAVAAPVSEVRQALHEEALVHVLIINTDDDCVIGGEAESCSRVLRKLGASRAIPLGYDMVAHCPEVEEVREAWWALHHRQVTEVPSVRLYTNATGTWYRPTSQSVADALTGQAILSIDFRRTIENAYADGIRIFVEHGPRSGCTASIRRILGDREHLAISLDAVGRDGVSQLFQAAAWLMAAGVSLDPRALEDAIALAAPIERAPGAAIELPAHPPTLKQTPTAQVMPPAPRLEPITAVADVAPAPADESPLGRLLAHHRVLTQAHRQFVEYQAQAQERFLGFQRAATERLQALMQAPPSVEASLPGPKFSRAQLELLSKGKISDVFGPAFAGQDGYRRQVRMPEPPLLLADRVTGIDAVPGSMGKGTLWTETDVKADSWYLNDEGYMPAGLMIESGQADLLLISYLGVDRLNQGQRVYRLLGCELTWHGGLPKVGDTLTYDIHVDGHATQGDVRLFFFHYDCHIGGQKRLSVRNGQAGFFTDEELAHSAGVLWNPEDEVPPEAQVAPSWVRCQKAQFNERELRAFAEGRPFECFGPGWEVAQAHLRSPRITQGKMQFLQEVTHFEPQGGPWRRGYLRAEAQVSQEDWFFEGHFKNDPCMPGTLMFEGCLQAMAVYLAGLGYTIDRDGWRFEPVPDIAYSMRCRGQVTPQSERLVYEVFVVEVRGGPEPALFADLLCTVDGRKAFHARRVGLQLVPDWPLQRWEQKGLVRTAPAPLAATANGFTFDERALLACAWGRPSEAFGSAYARFDGPRRAPRLPGPPYHCISRVTRIEGAMGAMAVGSAVEVQWDVPSQAWFFEQNGFATMPLALVMEAALQPCGWLASYVGSALASETDFLFRNLDGTGTLHAEVFPRVGVLETRATLLSSAQSAGMVIQHFEVSTSMAGQPVFSCKTSFGFFAPEAFENQVGLPSTDEPQHPKGPSLVVDLSERPSKYFEDTPRLGRDMLQLHDRITGYAPQGGRHGLGWVRGEKVVRADDWFFKAHFFQDPVQPGSLGVEALCQLLQFHLLEKGWGRELVRPRFEPIMVGQPLTWKYRGQVTPLNQRVVTEIQVTKEGVDERGPYVLADGYLWVDGKRIYQVKQLGMRIVAGASL